MNVTEFYDNRKDCLRLAAQENDMRIAAGLDPIDVIARANELFVWLSGEPPI